MQPQSEAMTEELVDEMVGQGAPADLMALLGFPLPVKVICDLLGVPDVDWNKLAYWSSTMLSMTQYSKAEIDAAQAEFAEYMTRSPARCCGGERR